MGIFCSVPLVPPASTCSPKSGGISKIKFHNFAMTGTPAAYQEETIDCIPETSHLESVYSFNSETRTGAWTNTLFIDFGEISNTNREAISTFTSSYFACEVEFIDGTKAKFGRSEDTQGWSTPDGHPYPCHASAANLNSGTKMEDKQGFDITITVKTLTPPVITDHN